MRVGPSVFENFVHVIGRMHKAAPFGSAVGLILLATILCATSHGHVFDCGKSVYTLTPAACTATGLAVIRLYAAFVRRVCQLLIRVPVWCLRMERADMEPAEMVAAATVPPHMAAAARPVAMDMHSEHTWRGWRGRSVGLGT